MTPTFYSHPDATVLQHARNVASTFGLALTNDELDYILWNRTSFPLSDWDHLTGDLERVFRAIRGDYSLCERCGDRTETEFYLQSGGLCGNCLANDALLPLTQIKPHVQKGTP